MSLMPWPRRMFFVRWLAAARKTSGQEEWRILLEEVVFDFPGVFDAELVGQFDLGEGVLEELQLLAVIPWPR